MRSQFKGTNKQKKTRKYVQKKKTFVSLEKKEEHTKEIDVKS